MADAVATKLASLGLNARVTLVWLHDIRKNHRANGLTASAKTFYKELPTTYPNLPFTVSW